MRKPDGTLSPVYELTRSFTLIAAKGAAVAAIDCVHSELGAGLKAECEAARRDGFDGKLATEADHVAIINACFP